MGLRLKFNLVLLAVFALGFVVSGVLSWNLLQRNARDEVVRNAELLMEAALAVRGYTVAQVKPHLDEKLEQVFLPQTVPAYAATET
ncbi:MAG: signal protein, partial [Burkholderiales bacterium]